MKLHNCPLASADKELVSRYLRGLPFEELLFIIGDVQSKLTATEQITYDINRFCNSYADSEGRITLLLTLIDDAIISPLCIPLTYTGNPESIDPARQKSYDFFAPFVNKETDESAPALTDTIEPAPTAKVEISNPRWEPLEEAEAAGDPEVPLLGDTVRLLADVKNYPDGASVTFDVYDVTESTPLRIATVSGKNSGGKASAEWKVEDPQKRGDALKLQFEAGAKSKYTEKADLPWEDKLKCDFVEMPDVLFHHNSAVPCLDEGGMLLGALTSTAIFTKENSGKEIVIFGHTDTSGDPAYNFDLSQWRSEGIKALLDNDKDAWLDVVDLASKVEDYQAILKTLFSAHGWECDPGKVDNVAGAKTTAAIKSFQDEYNSRFTGTLKVDGVIGPKTWVAIFETIHTLMIDAVKEATGEAALPPFPYGYEGSGIYPCGESFPVDSAEKDGYKSATNRRVEIVFYDKGKAPKLTKPADKKKVQKKENPVYDKKKVEKKPVKVKPAEPASGDNIVLDIVFPQINDATKPHKQYVNLSSNGKNEGVELTIKVKAKDLKADTATKRVYWRVTADANNSARNDPKTGIMEKSGGKLEEFAAGVANLDTAFSSKESSIVLACGLAGGDKFTVEVGTDGENFTSSFVVENWRKLWYQITYPDKMNKPDISYFKAGLDKAFITLIEKEVHVLKGTNDGPAGSWIDATEIETSGKGKRLIVGTHNRDSFHKLFKNSEKPREVHFMFCDHQLDGGSSSSNFYEMTKKFTLDNSHKVTWPGEGSVNGISFEAKKELPGYTIFPTSIQNGKHSIYKATWKSDSALGLLGLQKGIIPEDHLLIDYANNSVSNGKVFVRLPKDAVKAVNAGHKVDVTLSIYLVKGWYNGESDGVKLLIAGHRMDGAGKVDYKGINGTMLHELGHALDMVACTTLKIPGIPDVRKEHGKWYNNSRGHQGDHCANGISDIIYDDASKKLTGYNGDCVMYGAGWFDRPTSFCERCNKLVIASDYRKLK